jgi:hypothetical protein
METSLNLAPVGTQPTKNELTTAENAVARPTAPTITTGFVERFFMQQV